MRIDIPAHEAMAGAVADCLEQRLVVPDTLGRVARGLK